MDEYSDRETIYQWTNAEVIKQFKTNETEGLSTAEAAKRLEEDGLNKLHEEKTPKWVIFLRQLNNVVIYILFVAVALTLWMGHLSDAIVIGLVIVANTLIGYYQEINASNALEKIKDMLSTQATVIRNGNRTEVDATKIVKGDLVYLEAGDNIPADLRLIDADRLKVQESSLTGEAGSVEKEPAPLEGIQPLGDQTNMVFASTSVTNGNGIGVVVAIADESEIGKISTAVSEQSNKKTPLMKEIDQLGKYISYVILAVALILFIFGLVFEIYSLPVLSLAVITMIVGSVPEGLPATTSVVLAMGVRDMAKRKHTIIKTLPAVETLGSVDIIATDKTGTLTKNEMTAQIVVTKYGTYRVSGIGYSPEGEITSGTSERQPNDDEMLTQLVQSGFEANETTLVKEGEGWVINGEPTDGAFLTLYRKLKGTGETPYEELARIPFDSDYRYIASLSLNKETNDRKIFIKGSPDKLFDMAGTSNVFNRDKWKEHVDRLSKEGKRVIAVGMKNVPADRDTLEHDDLTEGVELLGLVGIIDPPREEVIESIRTMRQAGVEVKMITGDHPETATAIAKELGLAEEIHVLKGVEIDAMSEDELTDVINNYHVFARTTPKNKLQIVKAYQKSGKVTAMVGDGVNDAPALKTSNIGVAMGIKGTDVSRDSADMVLVNDDFSTMQTAIHEGRRIYDNIKKSILYLLPTSFAEGLIIAFTLLLQRDLPLQATQMLWINMVSAITIQFAFIFEPAEAGIMKRKPRDTEQTLINKGEAIQIGYVAILMAAFSLIAYDWLIMYGQNERIASTMVVNIMVMSKIFYLFNIRTHQPAFSKASFQNKKAFLIIGIMLFLQVILTYVPFMQTYFYTEGMDVMEWGIAVFVGLLILIVTEVTKFLRKNGLRL